MWPSTSWWMRAGSHVGIWLEIAVTMPNANDAKPSNRRIRRRRRSRSLRILLRRPFPDASPLRLRPNKRPILTAPLGGVDDHERHVLRGGDAAVLLLRHHHG